MTVYTQPSRGWAYSSFSVIGRSFGKNARRVFNDEDIVGNFRKLSIHKIPKYPPHDKVVMHVVLDNSSAESYLSYPIQISCEFERNNEFLVPLISGGKEVY